VITWLLHVIGVEPRSPSTAYNFWSGFGSDIGEFTLVGLVGGLVRHKNCHSHGCLRLASHEVTTEDGTYKVCRHCFKTINGMDRHPTVEELKEKVI
jgi:hypothetical protein